MIVFVDRQYFRWFIVFSASGCGRRLKGGREGARGCCFSIGAMKKTYGNILDHLLSGCETEEERGAADADNK